MTIKICSLHQEESLKWGKKLTIKLPPFLVLLMRSDSRTKKTLSSLKIEILGVLYLIIIEEKFDFQNIVFGSLFFPVLIHYFTSQFFSSV